MTSCLSQTAEEIVAEISMSNLSSPWIVIEGETDGAFFASKDLPRKPVLVAAKGWENVVAVVAKVLEESIAATVFGFIDRDYREELGITVDTSRIVTTDFRDLEISMFESGALHRILIELGSSTKIPSLSCGNIDVGFVKQKIYEVAEKLGRLRYFSLRGNKKYAFKKLDYSKIIDSKTLVIDDDKLISKINSVSESTIDKDFLLTAYQAELPSSLLDTKYLCSGHDVAELLGISLRKLWGTNNSKEVEREKIESKLRIGYSEKDFEETEMYKKLCMLLAHTTNGLT